MVDVLLEYIDLQSYFQSSTSYYAGIMLDVKMLNFEHNRPGLRTGS